MCAEEVDSTVTTVKEAEPVKEIMPILVVDRLPDFEPIDLYIADRKLIVAVLNKGLAYEGPLVFRVGVQESVVPQSGDFRFERIVELSVKIGTGGVGIFDMGDIAWPDARYPAIDHPQVRVGVLIDPSRKVAEANIHNNRIERTIRRDCGAVISKVRPDRFLEGLPSLLTLYGTFGYSEKTKRVVIRRDNQERVLVIADWQPNRLQAVLPKDLPAGEYEVLIACSERSCGAGYFASKAVVFSIARHDAEPVSEP